MDACIRKRERVGQAKEQVTVGLYTILTKHAALHNMNTASLHVLVQGGVVCCRYTCTTRLFVLCIASGAHEFESRQTTSLSPSNISTHIKCT